MISVVALCMCTFSNMPPPCEHNHGNHLVLAHVANTRQCFLELFCLLIHTPADVRTPIVALLMHMTTLIDVFAFVCDCRYGNYDVDAADEKHRIATSKIFNQEGVSLDHGLMLTKSAHRRLSAVDITPSSEATPIEKTECTFLGNCQCPQCR